MDVLSHALLGFIIGQALQLDTSLQLVLIASSISLDIDALSIRGREAAFRSHRGPLHSILAAIAASLLIATGYTILMHRPMPTVFTVVPICFAGLSSHLLLDLFTTGNMTALWPFSRKNLALNLTHFFDPIFLGALILAAFLIINTKTDVNHIQTIATVAVAFLALGLGVRHYEKNRTANFVKGLDKGTAFEIVSFPTIRPDRWWSVKKIPFENGYRYEIYRIDSAHNKILGKDSVESPHIDHTGPAQPPIDSPRKAIACSKRDKRVKASVDKFLLPAASITLSNEDSTWEVFWYDVFTHIGKEESHGILARIKVDGKITIETRQTTTI
ncbi:MAG: metal-dependent hydrolase [Candidatus Bathyarchaeota archaeon]|nr:MAG: metal-dependent hydrolase [Candidatus Bathyarchaeota archaeon]